MKREYRGRKAVRRYCLCGSSLGVSAASVHFQDSILARWDALHEGPGHGATTAREASRARARAEVSGEELERLFGEGSR